MNMSDPIRFFEHLFNQINGKLFRDAETKKKKKLVLTVVPMVILTTGH